jgi:general secretion pathway protein N
MKKRYFIISGIIAYLVFLIISVPAAPVLSQLQRYIPAVSIQGVSGSLWNGRAAAITINQQYTLDNTGWNFSGWRLFKGEVSAKINTHYQQQAVSGNFDIHPSGKITAHNVNASMEAATLAQLARIPLAELSGSISLKIDQLEWQPGQVPRASGRLQWNSAAVTVSETARLGDIVITLTENKRSPLQASISNRGGEIKLEGEANVSEDGNYSLKLNMLPDKNASRNVRSSLSMIAKPMPNGSFQLNNNGNLKTFGLI